MVIESGVHSLLHPNCPHQIVFAKFNLNIYYSPPYARLLWQYQKANSNLIQQKRIPQKRFHLIQKTAFTYVQRKIARRMQIPSVTSRGT